jgi:hypothetical protein
VTVREAGRRVHAVRVALRGKGVSRSAMTNTAGIAAISLKPNRPGILQIRVPDHATCNTQRVGVLGVFTPPVTG